MGISGCHSEIDLNKMEHKKIRRANMVKGYRLGDSMASRW